MRDHGASNDLTIGSSITIPLTDQWADWLLRRRHGGDPKHECVVLGMVQKIRDRVLDGARLSAGTVLLDVGAGDGLITFGAFERVGPSLKAVLTDVSAPLLKRAEERATECGVRDRCTFVQTSAERLDNVADASADVLITRAVLVYVADKAAAARQFFRVLKPGGRISIGEPIYRYEALRLAALTDFLRSRPTDAATTHARLVQRCLAAQLPSTLEEIQSDPLTNFSERELITIFETAGFPEVHVELHIDVRNGTPVAWDTCLDTAPRPCAPTLREAMAAQLSEPERRQLEETLRPLVESGQSKESDTVAYLTAVKPAV